MACCPKTGRTSSTCRGTRSCPTGPGARSTTRSCAACSTAGSCPASRRWPAACRCSSASAARRPATAITRPSSARRTSSATRAPAAATAAALSPVYTCDPRLDGSKVGEKLFDINCIGIPALGANGDLIPPYNLRMPTRINHDLTVFKNFAIHGDQKIQFRVGFFNLFNQAWVTTNSAADIDLVLDTTCNVQRQRRAQRRRRHRRQRLRPDAGLHLHAQTRSTTSGRST